MSEKSKFPLSAQIGLAMALGLLLGPLLGKAAGPFGEIATLVIQMIKAVAAPLMFLSIVSAILKTDVRLSGGLRMIGFAILNGLLALGLGMLISNSLQPGAVMRVELENGVASRAATGPDYAGKKIDFLKTLVSHVPESTAKPFVENAVIGIVVLALLFGFGLRKVKREQEAKGETSFKVVDDGVSILLSSTEHVLGWIIRLVPVAVFGVVAKTVGERGYSPFVSLGLYVAVGVLGLVLHVAVVYQAWILFYSRLGLRNFWRAAREPVIYAAGANSSLATLPITLRALDRLGVSKASSTLGACVGTNLNNDGIILYEGMAVLFVAQASGLDLSLGQQFAAAGICMIAAMGVAGVPEAGFISLALVLNTVGLPIEVLPLLLSVDWVVARARSVTNVLSDMVLSILVDGPRVGVVATSDTSSAREGG